MAADYLEFAHELAEQAGVHMVAAREDRLVVQRKPDGSLVTNVDHAINGMVIDAVFANFPEHAVIGEECSYGDPNADHVWRIDPLDGTGEYAGDEDPSMLTCGIGLAKQYKDRLEAGLFFNPFRNELYTAVHGLGAFLNSQAIRVGEQQFAPGVAYDYSHWDGARPDARFLDDLLGRPLNYYSAIYQGCMVAAGRSAFSVFPGSTAHDIAPAAIVVAEAGGRVSDLYGQPHNWRGSMHGALFSNSVTHAHVLEALDLGASSAQNEPNHL